MKHFLAFILLVFVFVGWHQDDNGKETIPFKKQDVPNEVKEPNESLGLNGCIDVSTQLQRLTLYDKNHFMAMRGIGVATAHKLIKKKYSFHNLATLRGYLNNCLKHKDYSIGQRVE